MIAYCVHCAASITEEFIIANGAVRPSRNVRCPNCGQPAGIKEPTAPKSGLINKMEIKDEAVIRNGKIE